MFIKLYLFITCAGILLEGIVKDGNVPLKILNCYGKYLEKKHFWDVAVHSEILMEEDLIISGDLNLTMEAG